MSKVQDFIDGLDSYLDGDGESIKVMNDSQIRRLIKKVKEECNQWIPVSEKTPTYGEPVLLKINGVVQNITYQLDGSDDSNDWFEPYGSDGNYDDAFFVDYDKDVSWMKLPPAK